MGNIIIALPRQENSVTIRQMLKASGLFEEPMIVRKGSEVLEIANNQNVKLVICVKRLIDMSYEELVSSLPVGVGVLLLTKDEALVPFSDSVTKLIMPFKAESLIDSVRNRIAGEQKTKKKRYRSVEEQETIDRAKRVLMERKNLTEPEAYRYLQKNSMDMQRSFLETAEMILVLEGAKKT